MAPPKSLPRPSTSSLTMSFWRCASGFSPAQPAADELVGQTLVGKGRGKVYSGTYEFDSGNVVVSQSGGGDVPPTPGNSWSTADQTLMKQHLDNNVLPYVEGTWSAWVWDDEYGVLYNKAK